MLNFFPVSVGQGFLSWKYGRPLDFCLNSLLKLVNLSLLHPKVDTTVFFFFFLFFKARSMVDGLGICWKCLLNLVNIFLFHLNFVELFVLKAAIRSISRI